MIDILRSPNCCKTVKESNSTEKALSGGDILECRRHVVQRPVKAAALALTVSTARGLSGRILPPWAGAGGLTRDQPLHRREAVCRRFRNSTTHWTLSTYTQQLHCVVSDMERQRKREIKQAPWSQLPRFVDDLVDTLLPIFGRQVCKGEPFGCRRASSWTRISWAWAHGWPEANPFAVRNSSRSGPFWGVVSVFP